MFNIKDIGRKSNYYIYRISDDEGKVYIGLTKDIRARVRQYRYEFNTDRRVQRNGVSKAMHEKGIENFNIEIIGRAETFERATSMETLFISHYNSTNPEKGYNIQKESYAYGDKKGTPMSEELKKERSKEVILFDGTIYILFDSAKNLAECVGVERTHITRAKNNAILVKGYMVLPATDDDITKSMIKIRHKIETKKYKKPYDIEIKRQFLNHCEKIFNRSVEIIPYGSTV